MSPIAAVISGWEKVWGKGDELEVGLEWIWKLVKGLRREDNERFLQFDGTILP
jgi:hypothetical protein